MRRTKQWYKLNSTLLSSVIARSDVEDTECLQIYHARDETSIYRNQIIYYEFDPGYTVSPVYRNSIIHY